MQARRALIRSSFKKTFSNSLQNLETFSDFKKIFSLTFSVAHFGFPPFRHGDFPRNETGKEEEGTRKGKGGGEAGIKSRGEMSRKKPSSFLLLFPPSPATFWGGIRGGGERQFCAAV